MTNNSQVISIREAKRMKTKRASEIRKVKRQAAPTAKFLEKMHKENINEK